MVPKTTFHQAMEKFIVEVPGEQIGFSDHTTISDRWIN